MAQLGLLLPAVALLLLLVGVVNAAGSQSLATKSKQPPPSGGDDVAVVAGHAKPCKSSFLVEFVKQKQAEARRRETAARQRVAQRANKVAEADAACERAGFLRCKYVEWWLLPIFDNFEYDASFDLRLVGAERAFRAHVVDFSLKAALVFFICGTFFREWSRLTGTSYAMTDDADGGDDDEEADLRAHEAGAVVTGASCMRDALKLARKLQVQQRQKPLQVRYNVAKFKHLMARIIDAYTSSDKLMLDLVWYIGVALCPMFVYVILANFWEHKTQLVAAWGLASWFSSLAGWALWAFAGCFYVLFNLAWFLFFTAFSWVVGGAQGRIGARFQIAERAFTHARKHMDEATAKRAELLVIVQPSPARARSASTPAAALLLAPTAASAL